MNMIQTILIDDQQMAVNILNSKLKEIDSGIEVICTAGSVSEGLEVLKKHKPDLLFLDIQMKDGTGFDLLHQLDEIDFEVIFITAYDHYALDAIKVNALDYILKPVDRNELVLAIERAKKRISLHDKQQKEPLAGWLNSGLPPEKIALCERSRIIFIRIDELVYCSADGKYTRFVTSQGKKYTSSQNLGHYEKLMGGTDIMRVHRSYLLNPKLVEEYLTGDRQAVMSNGDQVPVSAQYLDGFLKAVGAVK